MGSIAALRSVRRVMDRHGDGIRRDQVRLAGNPNVADVELVGDFYAVRVTWVLREGTRLRGPDLDLDALGERYPDCEVGY